MLSLALAALLQATSLHAPLLDERYHGALGSGFAIIEVTIAMPSLATMAEDRWQRFDGLPLEIRRLATRPTPTKPGKLDPSAFPAGTRFVPAQAIASSGFANRGAWLAFSSPIVSKDGLHAFVHYRAECGGLCGEEGYVWLRRSSIEGAWQLALELTSRVS